MYDFTTHKLIFSDHIFTGNHLVSTMKFHPTGMCLNPAFAYTSMKI